MQGPAIQDWVAKRAEATVAAASAPFLQPDDSARLPTASAAFASQPPPPQRRRQHQPRELQYDLTAPDDSQGQHQRGRRQQPSQASADSAISRTVSDTASSRSILPVHDSASSRPADSTTSGTEVRRSVAAQQAPNSAMPDVRRSGARQQQLQASVAASPAQAPVRSPQKQWKQQFSARVSAQQRPGYAAQALARQAAAAASPQKGPASPRKGVRKPPPLAPPPPQAEEPRTPTGSDEGQEQASPNMSPGKWRLSKLHCVGATDT